MIDHDSYRYGPGNRVSGLLIKTKKGPAFVDVEARLGSAHC